MRSPLRLPQLPHAATNRETPLPLDFFVLGELFQNNHHRAASRLNFAARWFEFDPTYAVLRVLAVTGVIRFRDAALEAEAA